MSEIECNVYKGVEKEVVKSRHKRSLDDYYDENTEQYSETMEDSIGDNISTVDETWKDAENNDGEEISRDDEIVPQIETGPPITYVESDIVNSEDLSNDIKSDMTFSEEAMTNIDEEIRSDNQDLTQDSNNTPMPSMDNVANDIILGTKKLTDDISKPIFDLEDYLSPQKEGGDFVTTPGNKENKNIDYEEGGGEGGFEEGGEGEEYGTSGGEGLGEMMSEGGEFYSGAYSEEGGEGGFEEGGEGEEYGTSAVEGSSNDILEQKSLYKSGNKNYYSTVPSFGTTCVELKRQYEDLCGA